MKYFTITVLVTVILTFIFTRYMERRQADEYMNKLHHEMIYGRRP